MHIEIQNCFSFWRTPLDPLWDFCPPRPPTQDVPTFLPGLRPFSHTEYVPTLTAAAALRAKDALSTAAWWPWPVDLESGVRVTCDVGYLCANFSLPGPLCCRLRPDV